MKGKTMQTATNGEGAPLAVDPRDYVRHPNRPLSAAAIIA
jgi:hypothetical protein